MKQMSRTLRLIYPIFLLAASCLAQQPAFQPHNHSRENAKEQPAITTAAVVVMDFDTHSVEQNTSALYANFQDVGRGVSSLLAEKLAQDGFYRVASRKAIDSVLTEQNIPIRARTDAVAVARISRPLGID